MTQPWPGSRRVEGECSRCSSSPPPSHLFFIVAFSFPSLSLPPCMSASRLFSFSIPLHVNISLFFLTLLFFHLLSPLFFLTSFLSASETFVIFHNTNIIHPFSPSHPPHTHTRIRTHKDRPLHPSTTHTYTNTPISPLNHSPFAPGILPLTSFLLLLSSLYLPSPPPLRSTPAAPRMQPGDNDSARATHKSQVREEREHRHQRNRRRSTKKEEGKKGALEYFRKICTEE